VGPSRWAGPAVVIPTLDGRRLLEECLAALDRQTLPAGDLIVVDNGSRDDTLDWLGRHYPAATVLRNPCNRGFAAAVNQGIRASRSEWVALLNNDAVPEPDWLAGLVAAGAADRRVGAVASRMMFRDARHVISSAGIRLDPAGLAWDLWVGETTWPSAAVPVFGASAGACLLRRAMLEDVGLFEESFFAYSEDTDLAWRARLRGWRALLAPDAVVYHALSATGGEGSPFKRYQLAHNRWRLLVRNYPGAPLLLRLPIVLLYDLLPIANGLVRGDAIPLRGRLDALRQLPGLLGQRRAIQARRTAAWRDLRATMSQLESPLSLYHRTRLIGQLATRTDQATWPPGGGVC
jgi:GT2 family glycosyltransferase